MLKNQKNNSIKKKQQVKKTVKEEEPVLLNDTPSIKEDVDTRLELYLSKIEEDINLVESRDQRVEEVLLNLLIKFHSFQDPRSLKSTNIEALTKLLDLYTNLPVKRAQLRKTIIDTLMKKQDLKQRRDDTNNLKETVGITMSSILNMIEQSNTCYPSYEDDEEK